MQKHNITWISLSIGICFKYLRVITHELFKFLIRKIIWNKTIYKVAYYIICNENSTQKILHVFVVIHFKILKSFCIKTKHVLILPFHWCWFQVFRVTKRQLIRQNICNYVFTKYYIIFNENPAQKCLPAFVAIHFNNKYIRIL